MVSTVEGTFKTFRHWLEQGFPESHSIDNAVKYALGQLHASVTVENLSEAIEDLETISAIANGLAAYLKRESERLKEA